MTKEFKAQTADQIEETITNKFQKKMELPIGTSIRFLIRSIAETQAEEQKTLETYLKKLEVKSWPV